MLHQVGHDILFGESNASPDFVERDVSAVLQTTLCRCGDLQELRYLGNGQQLDCPAGINRHMLSKSVQGRRDSPTWSTTLSSPRPLSYSTPYYFFPVYLPRSLACIQSIPSPGRTWSDHSISKKPIASSSMASTMKLLRFSAPLITTKSRCKPSIIFPRSRRIPIGDLSSKLFGTRFSSSLNFF